MEREAERIKTEVEISIEEVYSPSFPVDLVG
jgi:hypothetical protein